MSTPLYIHLTPCGPLPHLRPEPFKALLVVENIVPEAWRNEVCEWLAQAGCRSLMAWGQDSHQWQGAMNQTSSNIFGSGLAKDERVMTNARENETLADAIAAALHGDADFGVDLAGFSIVHITPVERRDEMMKMIEMAVRDGD